MLAEAGPCEVAAARLDPARGRFGLPVTAIVPKAAQLSGEDAMPLAGAAGAGVGDIGPSGTHRAEGSGP
jgi:hypothetical protein